MNKHRLSGVMALLSLLFFAVSVVSCVNEEYDMSEGNLNLEVTPFEEGVVLPLGSTEQIKLNDLLKDVDSDILNVGENGAYSISFSDSFDMTEELSSLKDLIDIPDVDFSEKVTFQMNDVDVSDVKIDAMDYAFEHDLSASFGMPELDLSAVSEKFEVSSGLNGYRPDESQMKLNFEPVRHEDHLLSLSDDLHIPENMINDDPIPVDGDLLGDFLNTTTSFEFHEMVQVKISLPEGISSVEDIVLHEGAGVKVTLELLGNFIQSGKMIPQIDVDLHNIFHLEEGYGGDIAHLAEDFILSEENGYKQSKTYGIASMAIDAADWKHDAASNSLVFDKKFDIPASGNIFFEDLMTTTRHIEYDRNIDVAFTVEFVDLIIDDIVMDIDPVEISKNNTVSMSLGDIEVPEQVKNISDITFTKTSGLDIIIKAQNIDKVRGLEVGLKTLAITFPKELSVEGADPANRIVINDVDLAKGVTKHVGINAITLPAPSDGKISFDGNIEVEAVAKAGGKVHSADLPTKAADDVKVLVEVSSAMEVADYHAEISGFDYALDIDGKEIKVEVPDALSDISDVVVYPEGKPEIVIEINIPDIALDVVPSTEGFSISFPQMLIFKTLPSSYNFDPVTNSITFYGSIPSEIKLPVEKLVLAPELDAADGKHYVKGNVEIGGAISFAEGTLLKADIDALSASGNKIAVVAHIPDIVPSTISLDTFETVIREEVELEIISAEDMPEELVALGTVELKDTYLNVSMDASALPKLGAASLEVELAVAIPSMIKVEGADDNGNLVISGTLDDKGLLNIDPVKIIALDLEGRDFKNGIRDVLVVEGSVRLSNAALDVDQWLGKDLEIGLNASIRNITISKVTGKVDYDVDPVEVDVDLSEFINMLEESGAEANLDFCHAHLALEVATNLGVPVNASVELVPYYDGKADENRIIPATFALKPSESVDKETFTRIWLAGDKERMPEGYDFVEADLLKILEDIPEKLEFRLVAGTDSERECVLEPSADYSLKANYRFELPLEFGEEFEVTYKTTVDGLPVIVRSLLSNGNKVMLAGEIDNALPLGLGLTFNFLDSYGNVVPMADGCGVQKIAPCGLDGSAVKTPLEVVLGLREGVNSADITSLELVFNANSAGVTGVPVTEDAYLQAVLQFVLPEGITVDLSDILNKEDE